MTRPLGNPPPRPPPPCAGERGSLATRPLLPLSRARERGRGCGPTSARLLLKGAAALALGAILGRAGTGAAAPLACGVPPREPLPFAPPDPSARWTAAPAPSMATVTHAGGTYRYEVDGRLQTIRGMGYNPPDSLRLSRTPDAPAWSATSA